MNGSKEAHQVFEEKTAGSFHTPAKNNLRGIYSDQKMARYVTKESELKKNNLQQTPPY